MIWKKQISQEVLSTTDRSRRRSAGNSYTVRASGGTWGNQAGGRMLDRRFGGLSQYKNEKGGCCTKFVASRNSLFLCLRETRTREGTQKEHPVSAVRGTDHPLLLPPRLCVLVAVERMFFLPSLYHRGAWKATKNGVISVSLETTVHCKMKSDTKKVKHTESIR